MSASTERKNRAAAIAAGTDKKTLAAKEAEEKARKSKRRWIIGTVAVVLCIALVLFLSSPIMYRITTAVSVGDRNYSPAEVKYIRAASRNALNLGGYSLDYNTAVSYFGEESANQLLENTVNSELVRSAALLKYAKENNITLSAYEKQVADDSARETMDALREAAKANSMSFSTFMSYVYGGGVNKSVIRNAITEEALVNKALFTQVCSTQVSAEDIANYYTDPVDAQIFDYVVYLVAANEERSLEEAQAAAQAVVDSFNDGRDEAVDPQVALTDILAEEFPEETPSVRTDVPGSQLDETTRPWLIEEGRQAGDITALAAPNDSGWYVVLFLDRTENDDPVTAVRHILILAQPDENGEYTEEAKAAAKAEAEEILDAFNQSGKTEAEFASLASLLSQDPGSRSNGGYMPAVTKGETVPEFDAFCFAEHQYGDTAVVYGESANYTGYHVIFFVETVPAKDADAREALRSEALSEWSAVITEGLEPVTHWANKLVD